MAPAPAQGIPRTPTRLSWNLFLTILMVGAGCAFLESVLSVPLGLISTRYLIQLLSKALRSSVEPDTWGLNVLKEPGYPFSCGTCTGTRGEMSPGCIFLQLPAPLSTSCHWHPGNTGLWVGAGSGTGSQEWWVVALEHGGILFTPHLILQLRKEPPGMISDIEQHQRRTQASHWQA